MFVENFPANGALGFEVAVVTREQSPPGLQFHNGAGILRSILLRGLSELKTACSR